MNNNYSDTHNWERNINICIFWDVGSFWVWKQRKKQWRCSLMRRKNSGKKAEKTAVMVKWVHAPTLNSKFKVFMLRVNATSERTSKPGGRDIQMSTHIFPGMRDSPGCSDHSCGRYPEQYGAHRRYVVSTDWVMNTWRQLRGENLIQEKWLRLHGRYIHITCSSSVLWSILRFKNNTKPTHQTKNKNKISLKTKEGRPEGMVWEPQFSSSELLSPGSWAMLAAALGGSLAGFGENTTRTPKNLNRRQWQMIVNLANFFIGLSMPRRCSKYKANSNSL